MPRSYRSIILTLAGLILVGANQPSDNTRSNPATAQGSDNSNYEKEIASGVSRIGTALEAQNSKTDPYDKDRNQREIRDLKAQENSAYWAQAMFWATVAALMLSLIGMVLVWITFRETRKANEITKSEQRPWVSANIEMKTFVADSAMIKFEFDVHAKNTGKTIAHNVILDAEAEIIEYNEKSQKDFIIGRRSLALGVKRDEGISLIPDDSDILTYSFKKLRTLIPWTPNGNTNCAQITVMIMVLYKISGEDRFREMTKYYTIGVKSKLFGGSHVIFDSIMMPDLNDIVIRRTGPTEAT